MGGSERTFSFVNMATCLLPGYGFPKWPGRFSCSAFLWQRDDVLGLVRRDHLSGGGLVLSGHPMADNNSAPCPPNHHAITPRFSSESGCKRVPNRIQEILVIPEQKWDNPGNKCFHLYLNDGEFWCPDWASTRQGSAALFRLNVIS